MYVGTNRIRVRKGTGHKLGERFAQRGGVERQPGFMSFQMWKLDADEEHEEYLKSPTGSPKRRRQNG